MDLRRSDLDNLHRLAAVWKTTPGAELEAMVLNLDLTGWQDVIQYLRSLGMREAPQLVKMNICLSNDIRLTLEGAGVIQAYCRDNRIGDKPFTAMLKETITDAEPVTLGAYGAKAKIKREIPLAADDARVKEALSRWDQLGKHFRNIQRFEFVAPGGVPVRFDVSIVRENLGKPARTFQEARVTSQAPRYEVEVELTADRGSTTAEKATQHIVRGLSWLLQGRQRSFVLVTQQASDYVRGSLGRIFQGGNRNNNSRQPFRFPGPQPATLERKNITEEAEPGVPNVRTMPGGYNVTDKADGLRCLLFVAEDGRVFLVDGGGRVYGTGKHVAPEGAAGVVLDGEWIRRDRKGAVVSHYYAFDILSGKGGDTGVAGLPFMIAGAMLGSTAATNTRQAVMASYVGILGSAVQKVRGVPVTDNLQVGMKTFRTGADIFQAGAAATLEDAKSAPYNTDGLIFTPNAAPLPIGRGGTWPEQLKWKPPHENTIDFLVMVDRERDAAGKVLTAEAVGTKYREDSGQTVRYKTLRLFVGSSRDAAFADPRTTVLGDMALPRTLEDGEWREVEFRPVDPRDPMASICYVAIDEGSADPAGATAAASSFNSNTDVIRTTRTGDILQSDMIVEMAYHPERAPGWRWEPIRIRHDKTERYAKQALQPNSPGSRKGGTMNADWVANSIWNSLHNPVTEDTIRSGHITYCMPTAGAGLGRSRANSRDQMKVQCMRNFHDYVKKTVLLRKTLLTPGSTLCDIAMSNGSDISKWLAAQVGFVFGCDVQAAALNNPEDGAYRRLLDKMIELGGRDQVPPMVFAQADAARRLMDGTAGLTGEDSGLLQRVFTDHAGGFDVVSCFFALQYMMRDEATLAGFLTNLADAVKVGGYFVGCCRDGDSVARLMASSGPDGQSVVGRDGKMDSWMLTKRYGSGIGSSVPPSAAGLGLAVDLEFVAGGETSTEYLVSWPYLQARLAECGLELLTAEELAMVGLPASTQMFSETWSTASAGGDVFAMTDAMRRLSFLNRWFVLKRRSDSRPAPPSMIPAPPVALTEVIPLPQTEVGPPAPEDVIQLAPDSVQESESKGPFLINAATKEPDQRLGPDLADWPRYMSLGTQVEIADLSDPTIKYPSLEAAIASAKYQKATDKPELGPSLFRVEGAIHQKFEKEREKLVATGAPVEALAKSVDDEVAMVRVASGKNKMKSYKAAWNQDAWDTQKDGVYQAYLAQRFATDGRFRAMVSAAKTQGGELMFVNGVDPSYLGVGVRIDGSIAGGDNMIGKWIAALA
jgi:hypothetical protein